LYDRKRMGSEPNGKPGCALPEERLNVFALVIYIPDPLGRFLDDLRRELVPHYNPHAHVSVLPPRPLAVDWGEASLDAQSVLESCPPFEIELAGVQTFPVTDVVYLDVSRGAAELHRLHDTLCRGHLGFDEPFPYCPHVTLAQEVPHVRASEVEELARRRWSEFRGKRHFRVQHAVFVQNTVNDCWVDLAEYELGVMAAKPRS
jgi:2'-5' RNA ligase